MGKHETVTAVALSPPPPRAPAVLKQRAALECELAGLRLQIAVTALAAFEGGGREQLAALEATIRTVSFQHEAQAAAHELAERLDRGAVAAWRAEVQSDPNIAIEGITKTTCCRRCSEQHGCTITGAQCGHPIFVGGVGPRLMADETVRNVYRAAMKKLGGGSR
jgi:hypothetical protein